MSAAPSGDANIVDLPKQDIGALIGREQMIPDAPSDGEAPVQFLNESATLEAPTPTPEVPVAPVVEPVAPTPTPTPVETPPVVAPVVPTQPVVDVAALQAQRDALLAQIEEMSRRVAASPQGTGPAVVGVSPQQGETAPPAVATPALTPTPVAQVVAAQAVSAGTLTQDEFMSMFTTPEAFLRVMDKVLAPRLETNIAQIATSVPNIVKTQLNRQVAVTQFFDKNTDLKPVREFCGLVANEVHASHPDWDDFGVLEEVGKQVRQRLGYVQQVAQATTPAAPVVEGQRPAFAPAPNARPPLGGPTLTGQQKFISELVADELRG